MTEAINQNQLMIRIEDAFGYWSAEAVAYRSLIAEFKAMEKKLQQADGSGSLPLLRELVMRGQFAFPENEEDLKWFEEGINHKFMEELMLKLSLSKEIEGNDR